MAKAKKLNKAISKFHLLTKIVIVVFLAIGIFIGSEICTWMSLNDRFVLKGNAAYSIDLSAEGGTYLYAEDGAEAYCFGMDVSDTLKAETDLQQDENGNYIIPTDKEGVYTITYTVDCLKFGENAPNGAIKRIRTFTVTATEEDGRNEQD